MTPAAPGRVRTFLSQACLFVVLALALAPVSAQQAEDDSAPYVADITLQTQDELLAMLERAERLLLSGDTLPGDDATVTFVLHGPVLESLLRDNYRDNKRLVDLAASLSALRVIDVKACSTWMSGRGIDANALQPFVSPVPYGPGLVRELVREKRYIYF